MHVLALYLVLVIIGQAISVGVGLLIDPFSTSVALAVFIPLYYAMYWVAWRVALMIADRSPEAQPTASNTGAKLLWLMAPVGMTLELCD